MAKKKKKGSKRPEKMVPVSLSFDLRVVQASPTTFIVVENMLKFAVVEVERRVLVVPLLEGREGFSTGCYVYPTGTSPRDAMKRTIDALWKRGVSWFLREKGKEGRL